MAADGKVIWIDVMLMINKVSLTTWTSSRFKVDADEMPIVPASVSIS